MKRLLFYIITFLSISHAWSFSHEIDIVSYDLEMAISLEHSNANKNSITAQANVSFVPDESRSINFLLNRLLKVESIHLNEKEVDFTQTLVGLDDWDTYQVKNIIIELKDQMNDTSLLVIKYRGNIASYSESGMLYVKERLDQEFFIIRPESMSFPQFAEPTQSSLMQRWRSNDTFDFSIKPDLPKEYVAACGYQFNSTDSTTFHSKKPIKFPIIPISRYQMFSSAIGSVYFFEEDSIGANRVLDHMQKSFQLYREWFGEPDMDDEFVIVEIPPGYGSQALFPTIIQTADAFRSEESLGQLYHEISHFWNVADSNSINSNRWNEGLAMFLQYLMLDEISGKDELSSTLENNFVRVKKRFESGRYPKLSMSEFGKANRTDLSYTVGTIFFGVLYRLEHDKFLDAYRDFYQTYKMAKVSDEQFISFMKNRLGDHKLFNDWFYNHDYITKLINAEDFDSLVREYR